MSHTRGSSLLWLQVFLVIFIAYLRGATGRRASGIYIDNGFDQTVVHHAMTERETRIIQNELLNLLDLPEPPPLKYHNRRHAATQLMQSSSRFMMDIYKNALNEESESQTIKNSEFKFNSDDLRKIRESDVIVTFAAYNRSMFSVKPDNGKRIRFDVSEISPSKELIEAELKLYRSTENIDNLEPFKLTVSRVSRLRNGESKWYYVNAVNTSSNYKGWITVNVSEALLHWTQNPEDNKGLYLSVHLNNNVYTQKMRPADVGIVSSEYSPEKQPFIVGFFRETGNINRTNSRRRNHNTDNARARRMETTSKKVQLNPYVDHSTIQKSKGSCSMKSIYVSFREMKWDNYILEPDGYDARFCSGDCSFPLHAHTNATNHAIIQTLVHLVHPKKVPKPCCVPKQLSPISVLYAASETRIVFKKYIDMIVKTCACL